MDYVGYLLLGIPLALALLFVRRILRTRRRVIEDTWQRVADRLELTFDPTGAGYCPWIHGRIGDLGVGIWVDPPDGRIHADFVTIIEVRGARVLPELRFGAAAVPAPAGLASAEAHAPVVAPAQASSGPALERLALETRFPALVAFLNEGTRRELAAVLADRGARIDNEVIAVELPGWVRDPAVIVARVELLTGLARRFAFDPNCVPPMLLDNAMAEPLAPLRRRNLEALLEHFPERPETARALQWAAANDRDTWIGMWACRHLDDAGWSRLEHLARSKYATCDVRLTALQRLIACLPRQRLIPILHDALSQVCAMERVPAIHHLGRLRDATAIDPMIAALAWADTGTAVAIADALVEIGEARTEPVLVELLQRPAAEVRIAAAAALGRLGTRAAIGPLLECGRAASGLAGGEVRQAVDAAVAAIQGRLGAGDTASGRLSLAPPSAEAGGLTLAGEAGALALAPGTAAVTAARAPAEVPGAGATPSAPTAAPPGLEAADETAGHPRAPEPGERARENR